MTITVQPENEAHWKQLRSKNINSTDVAALFGCSPYCTKFELWHRIKSGDIVDLVDNERMKWGRVLQDAIARGMAEENGWKIRPKTEYKYDEKLRAGSSFDFEIESPDVGLLEIKNVDSLAYRDGWLKSEDGDVEAPMHIEFQVQHQLMIDDKELLHLGALVGGNRLQKFQRIRKEAVIAAIRREIAQFWESIESNTPPEPVFPADSETVASLYGCAKPGSLMQANEEIERLASNYRVFQQSEKMAADGKKEIKARLLMLIGESEKVLGNGFTVSAGEIGPSEIEAHTRAGYRSFRISWKKGKENE